MAKMACRICAGATTSQIERTRRLGYAESFREAAAAAPLASAGFLNKIGLYHLRNARHLTSRSKMRKYTLKKELL